VSSNVPNVLQVLVVDDSPGIELVGGGHAAHKQVREGKAVAVDARANEPLCRWTAQTAMMKMNQLKPRLLPLHNGCILTLFKYICSVTGHAHVACVAPQVCAAGGESGH
jgi:hypothetical protein